MVRNIICLLFISLVATTRSINSLELRIKKWTAHYNNSRVLQGEFLEIKPRN